MNTRDLFEHFLSRAPWVDREKGCADAIRFGDETKKVTKIGTGWSDCAANLSAAAADGCDLFISHEVPFSWETRFCDVKTLPWYKKRVDILEASSMALMNLHDTWDHFPVYGVRDGFARLLGLCELVRTLDYVHPYSDKVTTGKGSLGIYRIPPVRVGDFARDMCAKIARVGAPGLCLNGDADTVVEYIAIGVGCHVPSMEALNAGAQLLIDVYDRHMQLNSRIPLTECGVPVITVEHCVAETYSMQGMAEYIEKNFPGISARYYHGEPMGTLYKA